MSTVVVQSPEHFKEPRCGNCGKPMRHNVPHLGPGGGWVHTDTGQATCGPRVELPMNAPKLTAPGKVETRHRVLSKNMGCSSPGASQALADFESEVIARHTNPFFLYANDPVFHAFVKAREEQAVAHYRSVECRNDSALIRLRGLIRLMGNVQDGSSETVKLYQDDATNVYFVNVGNQIFHGESFEQAVDSAIAGLESEA